ncbi:MAG: FkbM family methyltransferase [Chitinophagales bacterium]
MVNFYKKFIDRGDLCFDIGANIGERTDCFLAAGGKVIVVEPQRSCFRVLNKKYKGKKHIVIDGRAVGSETGKGEIMICKDNDECSTLSKEFVKMYSEFSGMQWQKLNLSILPPSKI